MTKQGMILLLLNLLNSEIMYVKFKNSCSTSQGTQ
jgi:hypothetical protein